MPDSIELLGKEVLLEVFRRMCLVRCFEQGIIPAMEEKLVACPVYLSTGQEAVPASLAVAIPEFQIFAQHRCHATYLSFGGPPERLRDELLGLPSGTSGGRAGSNCVQYREENVEMFGHHGLIGENVPLAVGAALGNGRPTVCFFGDGAAEEDYVFAAMGFAATHGLPVLFVCEDNGLSILTKVNVRRSWSMAKVAEALGMLAYEMSDHPWTILHKACELKNCLPAFLNIFTCRARWHVGVGADGPPEWDRYAMVREELGRVGLQHETAWIEREVKRSMEELWDIERLRRLSGK